MKIIKSNAAEFKKFFSELRLRGGVHSPELLSSVAKIVSDVAARGDKALFKYTAKFDGYKLTSATVEVTPVEKKKALAQVKTEDLKVIKLAAKRIEDYHRHQVAKSFMIKKKAVWKWDSGFCLCSESAFTLPGVKHLILQQF